MTSLDVDPPDSLFADHNAPGILPVSDACPVTLAEMLDEDTE